MPKGQKLISHVKITNTSSGKVVMLDGAEADSVITQIDSLTSENRNKAYIRYEDPATKNKIVLELCCVEIERLPSTVEEFDARECELDCCEQQFFGTFKTSVNQQTGEFPKKSQSSVPNKPSTPDKPKEDTPTTPSDNGSTDGSTTPSQPNENGVTDNGNVTPSNPSDNNGNTGTNPSTPSENNGSTDSGNTGNTDTGTSTQPSENSGSTDSGSVTPSQPSDNTGTTTPSDNTGNTDNGNSGSAGTTEPTTPSENGNTGTDTGTAQPSDNSGTTTQPDAPTVNNTIKLVDTTDLDEVLMEFNVKGKVGEQDRLGDIISNLSEESRNFFDITEDGKLKKGEDVFTLPDGHSSVLDYVYTIKENWHEESIQLKSQRV